MKYSCVQLNDLPDEILMIILKNLTNAEVLYSLLGVNKRLNNIAVDPVFINNLSLVMSTSDGLVYSLPDPILDRFCLHILPKIHQNIEWLHLQSRSLERILRATNFPNLYGISLHNIQAKTAIDLFTGGIFKSVREVSLFDERPFEHEFFLQIAQSFPFLEKLCVRNYERQMYKECSKSINGKQHLSIIKYPYLKQLNIICPCKDYHEQFLFDTKTCLPFDVRVSMYYKRVKQMTCNFTSNGTRNNCAKMNYANLYIGIKIVGDPENFCGETRELSEDIKSYFPRTQIDCLL
ncbi:unnamed protein product [Rotaria sp. Silwood1]|nr:unnamed protein product [Rotaria sp. Silwood1]CAF1007541.1 unnamed protein product [Rotaria sp. Silwood1]